MPFGDWNGDGEVSAGEAMGTGAAIGGLLGDGGGAGGGPEGGGGESAAASSAAAASRSPWATC